MWEGPAHCGWCHLWAGDTGVYRKEGWATMKSKSEKAAFLYGLCFSFCLQVPALTSCFSDGFRHPLSDEFWAVNWNKPFPPHIAFDLCFYLFNRKLTGSLLPSFLLPPSFPYISLSFPPSLPPSISSPYSFPLIFQQLVKHSHKASDPSSDHFPFHSDQKRPLRPEEMLCIQVGMATFCLQEFSFLK